MRKYTLLFTGLLAALSSCGTQVGSPGSNAPSATVVKQAVCDPANIALNKSALTSSSEWGGNLATAAAQAFDGNTGTRWSSAHSDPQWIQVDLGSIQSLCEITLQWETAYGRAFRIEVSDTGTGGWTQIYSTTTSTGGTQVIPVTGSGRYVRLTGTQRATQWGYSLWEFGIKKVGTDIFTTDTPDFGPNVKIFNDADSDATIQAALDSAFTPHVKSASAQFGEQRFAFLFKPGTYNVWANVGYYTHLAGLGLNPDDVTITRNINVDSGWNYGDESNATQNFWRTVENLAVLPEGGSTRWAVSQAAPMRRVHIRGNMALGPSNMDWGQGYASGGYLADSRVDGQIISGSQQQWYTRDSSIGSWNGAVWNMVFSGVNGAPAQTFPNPPHTTLATTPVTREKPYLYIMPDGKYRVFLPSMRTNSAGATWPNTPGTSLPMSQFYVAKPGDSAAKLNQALAQNLNLFFTPGVYRLNQTLKVTRANTVVMGIGLATLIPENGITAMEVSDVDGVRIADLLFDAGTTNSPVLLQVGPTGSSVNHSANPITVQDVYFRIGGAVAGKATTSLVVNAHNTILDHIWAWRGDHGAGIGWNSNTADHGVIVNGNNVLATGLFVEHYQKHQVIWNGQGGKTIFFQNEMPYDVPNQSVWTSGNGNGYAAYKVANSVTTHEAWGFGVYCFFNIGGTNTNINAARGIEVPNVAGVKMRHMLTVSLGNNGSITNVINNTGAAVPLPNTNTVPSYVVSYN
ncbi:discoidin domain-containing protein [Deinococcus cellulosilyticus]|uniref:Coagulation factor 5/8 type n=1 Tax=Deinococcus cellulosilyticus (strain DSM 18568 / NBRC 106333 / KACC 11606 / 5516J-15) TaxID=1223518 RepID=A0A511N6X5_DEIC1|nr:discoidin domain-containing protein [Deinococcus cellulosilyticus]GEM48604.1 coagulation factor 5/8 type [Deinococcus cellulosilyticus NBRC 106333 = KACC 11606]